MHDKLATFKWFERTISITCIGIPVVLRLTDLDQTGKIAACFRSSISAYVYMTHSYVFGLLLTMAAMLFVFNGTVYFNNEDSGLKLNYNTLDKSTSSWSGLFSFPANNFDCQPYVYPPQKAGIICIGAFSA